MMKSSATYQCAATVHAQTTPLALPTSRNMSPNTVIILVVSDGEDPYIIAQHNYCGQLDCLTVLHDRGINIPYIHTYMHTAAQCVHVYVCVT